MAQWKISNISTLKSTTSLRYNIFLIILRLIGGMGTITIHNHIGISTDAKYQVLVFCCLISDNSPHSVKNYPTYVRQSVCQNILILVEINLTGSITLYVDLYWGTPYSVIAWINLIIPILPLPGVGWPGDQHQEADWWIMDSQHQVADWSTITSVVTRLHQNP